jgi:HEAT repeat protein
MRHRRMLELALFLAVCCAGCGKSPPTLAGGKPVRYWIEALQNPDARVRKQAAFKLGNAGPVDADALPALLGALKDREAAVRSEAILALVKFGPAAGEAVPVLTELRLRDPNAQVRRYAAKAIEKLAN